MSRRKQKFPFHITGDGDDMECQDTTAVQTTETQTTANTQSQANITLESPIFIIHPREEVMASQQKDHYVSHYNVDDIVPTESGSVNNTHGNNNTEEKASNDGHISATPPDSRIQCNGALLSPLYSPCDIESQYNIDDKSPATLNIVTSPCPPDIIDHCSEPFAFSCTTRNGSSETGQSCSAGSPDLQSHESGANDLSAKQSTIAQRGPCANSCVNSSDLIEVSSATDQYTSTYKEEPSVECNKKESSKVSQSNEKSVAKRDFPSLICPVCFDRFKSKRAFNSHILVHCQLVKGPHLSLKRPVEDGSVNSQSVKRRSTSHIAENIVKTTSSDHSLDDESTVPLDLSCHRIGNQTEQISPRSPISFHSNSWSTTPRKTSSPELHTQNNHSFMSDRGPLEDENENLLNEAREHEKAFFDGVQNELYLTEDSTGFDAPPPLPLYHSGGVTRQVKVCSDDGPPMVYRIKFHSEQMLVSRILGTNEETGDKIELYKCFMCTLAFPSVSRLQAHLLFHKQRFICRKCNYSCDSRVLFSHHVQKHLMKNYKSETRRVPNHQTEDSNSAENTVTVAALLSALREKSVDRRTPGSNGSIQRSVCYPDAEEEIKSEESSPVSPASGSEESLDVRVSSAGGDLFKMYSCRFCNKKFDRAFSCNRHERVHTGYKPCFCRVCGRGFSEPRNLRHHVIRFHSDGSLRHLIKRDRRKRNGDDSPSHSPVPPLRDILKEAGNAVGFSNIVNTVDSIDYSSFHSNFGTSNNFESQNFQNLGFAEDLPASRTDGVNAYTTNLTKIFAASLDNSSRNRRQDIANDIEQTLIDGTQLPPSHESDNNISLEPGEIRLGSRSKIVDDEERGRRIVITDDNSEEGLDHSPQFSSYAPRLNIVQDRVSRDKALTPITDEIGRTFYECPYCRKLFGSTSDLNRHLDFHEDLRPYDCDYCNYSARTNSQLKVHKMRHEGIKQFSCDVCNYNGVTQSDLNRHKKTQSHIARSQNICSMCGLGFYSSSQKQVHIMQCHPEMEGASSLIQMSLGIPSDSSVIFKESNVPLDSTSQTPTEPTALSLQ